jgi:hypothetical protein
MAAKFSPITLTPMNSVDSMNWLNDATEVELLAGDFNGDNRQDIVIVSVAAKKHYVMHAGVDGQLSVVQTINGNAKWGNKRSGRVIIRDFDGDGRDDVFSQSSQKGQQHTITYADENGHLTNKNTHKINAKITDVDWHGDEFSIGAGNINDDKAVGLVRFNNASGGIDENGVIVQGAVQGKAAATSNHSFAPSKNKASTTQSLVGVPSTPTNYPGNGGNSYKPFGITYSIPFDSVAGATYYELYESANNSNYSIKYSGSGNSANFIHYLATTSRGQTRLQKWESLGTLAFPVLTTALSPDA